MKKFFAILLALVMVLSLSVTAFAAQVTIPDGNTHTFKAYQIFTGTQSDSEVVLCDVAWGDGINATSFLNALQSDTSDAFKYTDDKGTTETTDDVIYPNVFNQSTVTTAAHVADWLSKLRNNSDAAEKFAKLAYANKTETGTTLSNGNNSLADGYYLIVDITENLGGTYDVANPALLQVTRDIEITSKTNKPTVDKKVWDETDDAETNHKNGWGETADHAINESFQFKLTANLPDDTGFDRYAAYEVKFTDTWSEGITYEGIESITVDGVNVTNTVTPSVNVNTRQMVIDIPNVKAISGVNLTDGADVVVIYNAHLNESAVVTSATTINNNTADDNQNHVYLEYSNNPDGTGLGRTTTDTVYVFTYEVDNTKYKNSVADENKLGGVGFRLYSDEACNNEISLIFDSTKGAYRPTNTSETGEQMTSASDGKFNIVGLDAGTYYLKETAPLPGFNTCDNFTIVIAATHVENSDETSATVTFTKNNEGKDISTLDNKIINNSGSILPETGGIGTTIFYVVGSLLVLAAGVLLITKKRMASRG